MAVQKSGTASDHAPKQSDDEHRTEHAVSETNSDSSRGLRAAHHDAWDAEQQDNNIVSLTRAEAEKLFGPNVSRPSRVTPYKVVAAQMVLSLGATLLWWLFYKPPGDAALSAFLGGAICWVPSALFAARLKKLSGAETVMSWMIGEALKMGATIAMFVAIAFWYHGVQWVPLLVTYLIALKTYWIALAWR
ncbi:ATP synthase subunit I [Paraburkholderia rhizosphaerae]|uniref:ATP synthase protein I n=1 Tax=Paraburkholderia rhizosphaerae TaxID=480658 RepID=A0A4R8LVK7_9BURK|nr:ATP synthase subunit I [Paraburkholderia rhizosphaerae]TDY51774.1 ATP synthase protein I [Paraburkholderia rhizosphaerae]